MRDIATREDIEFLMKSFYNEALKHPVIGVFFTKIVKINLQEHIPDITDFWEQQLLKTGGYKKNVMQIHKNLNLKMKLEQMHFEIWLSLFNNAVNDHFEGEKAELIKTRALSIATMIQIKVS